MLHAKFVFGLRCITYTAHGAFYTIIDDARVQGPVTICISRGKLLALLHYFALSLPGLILFTQQRHCRTLLCSCGLMLCEPECYFPRRNGEADSSGTSEDVNLHSTLQGSFAKEAAICTRCSWPADSMKSDIKFYFRHRCPN